MPKKIAALEKDQDVLKEDHEAVQQLISLMNGKKRVLPTDLLQFKEIFRRYGDFRNSHVLALVRIANFFGI